MSPTLNFEKVATLVSEYDSAWTDTINVLTDGTLLVRVEKPRAASGTSEFWASTDDGETWTKRSELFGSSFFYGVRAANFPGNIICVPSSDGEGVKARISRSTDGGNTWATVLTLNPGNNPTTVHTCGAILSYSRTKAIAVGILENTPAEPFRSNVARSLDSGENWTIEHGSAIGTQTLHKVGPSKFKGGTFLCAQDAAVVMKSTNYGSSWTPTGTLPIPAEAFGRQARATCWVTATLCFAVGVISDNPPRDGVPVWRSTDAGATWSRIDKANFDGWDTGGPERLMTEIKRLTKDAIIIGSGSSGGATQSPWWWSKDQGVTWQKPTDGGAVWTVTHFRHGGAIVTSKQGSIFSVVGYQDGLEQETQIWRGRVTC